MIRHLWAAICLWMLAAATAASEDVTHKILEFDDLEGWNFDTHERALEAFLVTCPDLRDPDWSSLCALAQQNPDAKTFFELFFRPMLIENDSKALFTGYFEPELDGALSPSARYRYPLYREPEVAKVANPWLTRREIETGDYMNGKGYEIAWVDDPVELFFLQIQGSGRIRLPSGRRIRVGYGGSNGHPYRSIGVELVRRGIYKPHQVSAEVIKNWVKRNPQEGRELLFHNPSYVFFRRVDQVPPEAGPLGAMNRSVTAKRTIAVDPAYTPLGAPVWVEKKGADPFNRLMIAQDTGSAIKGPQRADVFFGTGDAAGKAAGMLKDPGRMVVLLPIQRAFATATEPYQ
ncbi:murein transglycosylase A [Roseovarius indicus]|uniref:peptidoglycan lytic exotransglycosylase n=1 Tax=Roseovarius indicus TaxID=540747 RepID=A0A0T5PDX6_9RHOB|nr:MltA domain-containing protein [Roseovarius indicus]KRS19299.1 murein transglycosylase [Roseovarius indicus]QEW29402.1 Membrane-bound lytic murein transglycosylase A precursor [Roseovarius indicus]SFD75063.1 membrane-bound lytic murein transglycosylase A [Roseovarius indicus]